MPPRNYRPRPAQIEHVAHGIAHGPYPDAPSELIEQYVNDRHINGVSETTTDEQLIEDTKSSWQYDQHSAAVMDALEKGEITPTHAVYMLETVLRPWYIGTRNTFK